MKHSQSQPAPKGVAALVKETLIAMAKDNVQGTPANYKRYYESIAGSRAPEDTGSMVLQKLQDKLKLQSSPLVAEWENAVYMALTKRDPSVIEELILKAIRVSRTAKNEGSETGSGETGLASKTQDDPGSAALRKLLDSLKLVGSPFVAEWEYAFDAALTRGDSSAIEDLILKAIRSGRAAKGGGTGSEAGETGSALKAHEDAGTTALRKLLDSLKSQGSPFVAEWENAIEAAVARGNSSAIETLILKAVHTAHAVTAKTEAPALPDKPKISAEERSFNNVLYVMESFARNLEGLYPENPMLMGQIEIVKDLLEHPKDTGKMYSAKRALAKMAAPEKIQVQLGAAKASANNLADTFLTQISETGNDAGEFLKEIEAGKKAMESAKDQAALLAASQALLSGTTAVHGKMKENQEKLENSKKQAQKAAEKIRTLEEEVKVAGEKAKQDYLTGLLNRQGMNEEIAKLFGEGWEKVTLALLDIDNVNKLSEQLGQKAVDEAIVQLADAIRESVGTKGVAARMGDEEFVVVFSGYGDDQVKEEMEKLQRFLTRKIFMADQEKRVVTFSAGVAQRASGEEPAETLARADEAMYMAKTKGKNRVEISELC